MDESKFEAKEQAVGTNGHPPHPEIESLAQRLEATAEGPARAGGVRPVTPAEASPAGEAPAPVTEPAPAAPPAAAADAAAPVIEETGDTAAIGAVIREYVESIIITLIIAFFITTFILQAYKIPTGSMESNLLIGDHLLVNKFAFARDPAPGSRVLPFKEIRRGDVLVFKFPENPEQAFVKRVIGLPGDTVTIAERQVIINGEPLDEDYTQFTSPESVYRPTFGLDWTVPEGHYFVMGDNRDNSRDSREWGFVPRDYVIGKPLLIYWSFETEANEHQRTSLSDRLGQVKDVVLNFVNKTRWDRTFKLVR